MKQHPRSTQSNFISSVRNYFQVDHGPHPTHPDFLPDPTCELFCHRIRCPRTTTENKFYERSRQCSWISVQFTDGGEDAKYAGLKVQCQQPR